MKTAYGLKTRTRLGITEAEAKVRELLAGEGFGILTEIDVAATFHEQLGATQRVIDVVPKGDANA